MKAKYLFLSLVATVALFTSCNDKYESTYLDNIQVSTSYVAIPVGGGETSISFTANSAWTVDTTNTVNKIPSWLTVSALNGSAGTTTLKFSAAATVDGRSCELKFNCNGESQYINVIQGLSTISTATCAEVINGVEGKTYQVTGKCTAIANTTYGNWYLNDGTGEIYVYGTVDASGSYNWSKFNIEVGDEVTVQGARKTYGSTIEFVDAAFVSVSKSLIKVNCVTVGNDTTTTIPQPGSDFTAHLTNKGTGIYVEVPEDAQDWLSIKSISGSNVTFHAEANTNGPRNTTIVFKTQNGGKDYTSQVTITQKGLSGTKELPFTVEEAIEAANEGITGLVYVKGIVSDLTPGAFSSQYGNGSFYISADGAYHSDKSLDFEVFRTLWLGNNKWTDYNAQIAVGQEVVVCGELTTYNGTAEFSKNTGYVCSVNGVTTDENGTGSEADPFNALGAIAAANAGCSSVNVFISGKITKIQSAFSAQYGNGTFWLSEGDTYAGDKTKDFEVYRCLWLDNQKWVDGDAQPAEGDLVVVKGLLTVYSGTAETQSGKAYVYNYTPANGARKK